jgi:hypothetical protein
VKISKKKLIFPVAKPLLFMFHMSQVKIYYLTSTQLSVTPFWKKISKKCCKHFVYTIIRLNTTLQRLNRSVKISTARERTNRFIFLSFPHDFFFCVWYNTEGPCHPNVHALSLYAYTQSTLN